MSIFKNIKDFKKEDKEFIINSRRTENERYIMYKLWEKIVKKDK